jgi:membrane-bound serine protease (ClpP class)
MLKSTNFKHRVIFALGVLCFIIGVIPAPGQTKTDSLVYVIEIKGVIEKGLATIVDRLLDEAEKAHATAVIFEVNTPGGAVDAAGEIRDRIFDCPLPTIAYVNREAISAGALISLSCEKVVMVPGSTIGAVTPVDLSGTKASEKAVSYMRGVMRAIAEKRGRDPQIAEAMVDESLEIEGITEAGKLLTLTAEEALKLNYADKILDNIPAVLEFTGNSGARIVYPKANWSENMVRFLTHPLVSSLLLSLGFLGLIYEVTTQGWGISGTVGLIALGLFFGAHYLAELANIMEILIFILGVVLLMVEIFFIPGFGLLGILGILAILTSVILSLVGNIPSVGSPDIFRAVQTVALSLIFTIVFAIPIFKYLPKTTAWTRLVLKSEQKTEAGFRATPGEYEQLLGKTGIALSTLRPSGTALIETSRITVVSNSEFIEKNSRIEVVQVEGNRVVVRKA